MSSTESCYDYLWLWEGRTHRFLSSLSQLNHPRLPVPLQPSTDEKVPEDPILIRWRHPQISPLIRLLTTLPSYTRRVDAWTELKTRMWILYPTPAISAYISYFEKTWLFSTSYPISMWNVSSAVEYDEQRTNNASEGGNNALNRAFNSSHPTLWSFISTLRKFHAEVETQVLQIAVGTQPCEPVAKKWKVRDARIKHLVDGYNPAQKLEFIRKIGYLHWICVCDCLFYTLCIYVRLF